MSAGPPPAENRGVAYRLLERLTAAVLLLVIGSLVWMIAEAYGLLGPAWASAEAQVVAVLTLLTAALVLVSVVALLHTR